MLIVNGFEYTASIIINESWTTGMNCHKTRLEDHLVTYCFTLLSVFSVLLEALQQFDSHSVSFSCRKTHSNGKGMVISLIDDIPIFCVFKKDARTIAEDDGKY